MTTQELQRTWPEWQVIEKLGEGSFGAVYKIMRPFFDKEELAALKVIRIPQNRSELARVRSEGMDDAAAREYFYQSVRKLSDEIDLLAKLKGNSNIVSYEDYKIIEDEDDIGWTLLIRMELLTPLRRYLEVQPLSESEIVQLGLDISTALNLCEKKRIVHRDIKPENIFISASGYFKLGDFGVAREMERTTANMSRKGTVTYMAPEVFHGRPYNATADIYSLGIVMYSLLNSNRMPFLPPAPASFTSDDREQAQLRQLSGEAIPPLAHVPALLNGLVLKMCAFEAKDRFPKADDLYAALLGIADEYPPSRPDLSAMHAADKTVSLRSLIGDNSPSVVPPSKAMTEEPSLWLDGSPSREPKPKPVTESEPPAPELAKKPERKKVIAVLAAVLVVAVAAISAVWFMQRDKGIEANGGIGVTTEETSAEIESTDTLNIPVWQGTLTPTEIQQKVKGSIVSVQTTEIASGILLHEDATNTYTYILTSAHVVSGNQPVNVVLIDGQSHDGEIVGIDSLTDIGLLQVKKTGLDGVAFGDSSELKVDYPIYSIRNNGELCAGKITAIILSAFPPMFQHTIALAPEEYGSILFNPYGQAVGMNTQNGYAIPSLKIMEVVNTLIQYGFVAEHHERTSTTTIPITMESTTKATTIAKPIPAGLSEPEQRPRHVVSYTPEGKLSYEYICEYEFNNIGQVAKRCVLDYLSAASYNRQVMAGESNCHGKESSNDRQPAN